MEISLSVDKFDIRKPKFVFRFPWNRRGPRLVPAILIALGLLLDAHNAQANRLCSHVFSEPFAIRSEQVLLMRTSGFSGRIERLLRAGLISRYAKDTEVQSLTKALEQARLTSEIGGGLPQEVLFDWKNCFGRIRVQTTASTLRYEVPILALRDFDSPTGIMSYGAKSSHLSLEFTRTMAALMNAISKEVAKHHSITSIEIVGGNVLHPELNAILSELGFQHAKSATGSSNWSLHLSVLPH